MIVARPLGSKAGTSHRTRTLLPLKAEITPSQTEYPQRTNSALMHRSDLSLFDHQVGAAKQRKRYGKAEGFGGF